LPRLLSHAEIETALSCWARHAFAYTGHLTEGTTLRSRQVARILSEGRAHGSAAAAYHARGDTLLAAFDAGEALYGALKADELEMMTRGVELDADAWTDLSTRIMAVFAHYMATTTPLGNLTRMEDELNVAIPSRTGRRSSTRYRFVAYIDGWTVDDDGLPWLVEFKLRKRLSPVALLQTNRQLRWMAWALRRAKGIEPVGVLVDEHLNEMPREPRILKDGSVSQATNQLITVESYLEACRLHDTEASPELVDHLTSIRWGQRVPIIFSPGELDEAGEEIISAAKLIRDLDSGELAPIRHATRSNCNGCRFAEICPHPEDDLLVDTLFERTVPKRLRNPEEAWR
jgi:hypothetical protein